MQQNTNKNRKGISRRRLLQGAAAVSSATLLSAFPKPSLAEAKAINVLTLSQGIFGQPFVDLSPEFTKATGIKVNLITMGYNEAIEKQVAAFAAKSSAYDVVQVDSIFIKGYAKAGHIQPLDGLIPNDQLADYFSDVPPTFKDMYADQGKTFGMATIGNCQRFIYNDAHLKDAGVGVPETWDDLLKAAQKVVDPSKNRYGFVAGTERLAKAFSVWLPTAGPAQATHLSNDAHDGPTTDPESILAGTRLLVVEDDPDVCAMLQIVLGDRGANASAFATLKSIGTSSSKVAILAMTREYGRRCCRCPAVKGIKLVMSGTARSS